MGGYLPSTPGEREAMLRRVGAESMDALFDALPASLRGGAPIPKGLSELELDRRMSAMAAKNRVFSSVFRGAGAYRHYIPALVDDVAKNNAFLTAYTPYQAEISQGVLQSIFEYQSMIAALTGMEVSNASVYDGASAAAEAAAMCRERARQRVFVSAGAHPMVIETMRTYCFGADAALELLPLKDGVTDPAALAALDDTAACVYIQQPNFLGMIEDAETLCRAAHERGAKFIMGVNPIAAALLKTPGEIGADIAVGEGQPLGLPLAFGGPWLGFMAAKSAMTRRLPGRIVGETLDAAGERAFVLTLQAREQHIRREKASSNICSNQALCALRAGAYMAVMGPEGMRETARLCFDKAHYLAGELAKAGLKTRYDGPFFHEFLTDCPVDAERLLERLAERDILGGLPVDGGILWCATELNTKAEMDALVKAVRML
ncbi:MAG: aminomethyl-transferring glycine dehydrogenase subunit GcvPA [Clostridia bacterium]|nr:aminomethyl-transferring glycine dehydrogenase subunit GcvPA [Clostridia bacterium]